MSTVIRCEHCHTLTANLQALRAHISQTPFCRKKDKESFQEPESEFERELRDSQPSTSPSNDSDEENFTAPSFDVSAQFDDEAETVDDLSGGGARNADKRRRVSVEEVEDDNSTDPKSIYGSTDTVYMFPYPGPAGAPLSATPVLTSFEELRKRQQQDSLEPWAPFHSKKEWELAQWLMKSGVSQKKIDEFCKLKTVQEDINPSFHNSRSFLKFVDALDSGPAFHCTPIQVQGDLKDANGDPQVEILELWHRNPVELVKELMGNPAFRGHQRYAPVRLFRNEDGTNREYSEMWTCNWWWDIQEKLPEKFATICPCIIASDETQLSTFSGDKKAWPVYISIGNIEKGIQRKASSRAFLLLGYIPTSKLECFSEKVRSVMGYQLFHDCMKIIMEPLEKAGREGVRMVCADGFERLVYPLLAAYIADYPEQCLVCCCKENSCPKCTVDPKRQGELLKSVLRTPELILETIAAESQGLKPAEFHSQNLRPINPFWRDLPHCNIFDCMTPDLLHQLHKGLFGDHVSTWTRKSINGGDEEIDNRFRTMTPHPTLRQFSKGISAISQWTGNEYKAMAKVFPGMLAGVAETRVLQAVRAFEDFMYYAHFEVHTDESLEALDDAWKAFHEHKEVFRELEIRTHFNISKLHNVSHYSESIRSRGTTDGFNSETSERIHIDLAKTGYRASNKRNFQSQMTKWLTRQESMNRQAVFIDWMAPEVEEDCISEDEEDGEEDEEETLDDADDVDGTGDTSKHVTYHYAKDAASPHTTIHEIETEYNCGEWFLWYLREFLEDHALPTEFLKSPHQIVLPVWKQVRLQLPAIAEAEIESKKFDTIRATKAKPMSFTASGVKQSVPARTSTVVVQTGKVDARKGPLDGLQAARIRLLFKLPSDLVPSFPHLLAFVDWFTPFHKYNDSLGMYQVSYASRQRVQHSGIILVDTIQQTCHLSPDFGRMVDPTWSCDNVLDRCKTFYVNPYLRNRDFMLFRYQPYLHTQGELARQAAIEYERARNLRLIRPNKRLRKQ